MPLTERGQRGNVTASTPTVWMVPQLEIHRYPWDWACCLRYFIIYHERCRAILLFWMLFIYSTLHLLFSNWEATPPHVRFKNQYCWFSWLMVEIMIKLMSIIRRTVHRTHAQKTCLQQCVSLIREKCIRFSFNCPTAIAGKYNILFINNCFGMYALVSLVWMSQSECVCVCTCVKVFLLAAVVFSQQQLQPLDKTHTKQRHFEG